MINNRYLITGAKEGTCLKTSAFESEPKFILAYKGHHFDKNWNIHKTEDWDPNDPRWAEYGIRVPTLTDVFLRQIGLYWVGIPPRKVDDFDMAWSEWGHVDPGTKQPTNERVIRPRKEKTRFFFVMKFGYAFDIKGLETRVGFKVNARFTVFVEGTNPKIALIDNDDWFLRFEGLVRRRCKNFFGAKSFYQLLSEEEKAQALLKKYNPVQRYLDKKHRDEPDTEEDPIPISFSEYMTQTRAVKKPTGEIDLADIGLTLSETLGVRIVDATFEDIDLDINDPLGNELSKIEVQAIENARKLDEAEAERKIMNELARGEAEAMDIITAAKANRQKVHEMYQGKKEATTIALAETNSEIAGKYAEAVKENKSLQSVVLPNSDTKPVFDVSRS